MTLPQKAVAGLLLGALLFGSALLVFTRVPTSEGTVGRSSAASPASVNRQGTRAVDIPEGSANAPRVAAAPLPDGVGDAPKQSEEIFQEIEDAMTTYSEEGLPVLKPYLSHPDPEIREAAVEAIVQLAVPSGAAVLKDAARRARSTEEQIRMLEGAEFLELPRLPLDKLRTMIESGEVQARVPIPPPPAP